VYKIYYTNIFTIYFYNIFLQYNINKCNNDVILTQILKENDYVCREPMLGYEDEQGGSIFK
jgi:hypothetical protein